MGKSLITLIFIFFINTSFAVKKNLNLDIKSFFDSKNLDIQDKEQDLLFQYQIYKKLIQDNFLDQLIIDTGFEPNDQTRSIFFSTLTKELQDLIKQSFRDFTNRDLSNQDFANNQNNLSNKSLNKIYNGIDPNVFIQLETSRNLSTIMNVLSTDVLDSKLSKKKEFKLRHIIYGGIFIYFISKFAFISKGIKAGYRYMRFNNALSDKQRKNFKLIESKALKFKRWSRSFLGKVFELDYSQDYPESKIFFDFLHDLEDRLRHDEEFVSKKAANFAYIEYGYRNRNKGRIFKRRSNRPKK